MPQEFIVMLVSLFILILGILLTSFLVRIQAQYLFLYYIKKDRYFFEVLSRDTLHSNQTVFKVWDGYGNEYHVSAKQLELQTTEVRGSKIDPFNLYYLFGLFFMFMGMLWGNQEKFIKNIHTELLQIDHDRR